MKKFMIAIAATIGLGAAATAPAQAGGVYFSASSYYAPTYVAPVYAQSYFNPFPVISLNFGNRFFGNTRRGVTNRQRLNRRINNVGNRNGRLINNRGNRRGNR